MGAMLIKTARKAQVMLRPQGSKFVATTPSAFDVWLHYSRTGAADKDTMIKIVSGLNAFSTAVLAYNAKQAGDTPAVLITMGMGMVIALTAIYTSLLYGAYAAWNWGITDKIAGILDQKAREKSPTRLEDASVWSYLLPEGVEGKRFSLWDALRKRQLAPVFWAFALVSLIVFATQLALAWHVGVACRSH
jgi:hypothetical protein